MDQGRKDSSFYRTIVPFVRSLMGPLIIAAWPGLALAQGGETEVTKTIPSNPPPVVSAPVPAPPPPAAPAHVAAKAASPIGGSGSGWGAKTAQPPQSPPQPQTPA